MSSKPRVQTRLKQAVGASQSKNKCSDLKTASENFEVIKKRLKVLIETLKAHHESLIQAHKTRMDAVGLIATLSLNTPIFSNAGQLSCEGDNALSYASVHSSVASQQKMFLDRYGMYLVNYVVEWEKVLTERIPPGLKKAEEMRIELDHYEEKIKPIRVAVNVTVAKEKKVDAKLMEKYRRNDEKLTSAKVNYEKFVHALCVLIDEATIRSWKDLHPLLIKMTQYDVTVARSDAKALSGLDQVLAKLKSFSQEHNLKESRLKDFQKMDAFELSGINEEEYLAMNASHVTNNYIKTENETHDMFGRKENSLDFLTGDGNSSIASSDSQNGLLAIENGENNFGNLDIVKASNTGNNGHADGMEFMIFTNEKNIDQKSSPPPPTMDSLNRDTNQLTLSAQNSNNHVGEYSMNNNGNDFGNSMNGFNNNPAYTSMNNSSNSMTNVTNNMMSTHNNSMNNINNNSGGNNMSSGNNNFDQGTANFYNNSGNNGNMNSFNNYNNNPGMGNGMSNFNNSYVQNNSSNNNPNHNQVGGRAPPVNANIPLLQAPMPSSHAPPSPPSVINPSMDVSHNKNGGHGGVMHNGNMITPYYGTSHTNKQQLQPQMNAMTTQRSNSGAFDPFSDLNNQSQAAQRHFALKPSANSASLVRNSSNDYANPFIKNSQ